MSIWIWEEHDRLSDAGHIAPQKFTLKYKPLEACISRREAGALHALVSR
ncbi:MAG: hypothetical protein AAGD25_26260 [Cyanobacteria bacterium P01_F01_bin.150]